MKASAASLVAGLSRRVLPFRNRCTLVRRKGRGSLAKKGAKQEMRSAKSQASHAHPDPTNFYSRVKPWERIGYFRTSQRLAAKQRRFSLSMDATEVSYTKTLNATMCLPELDLTMWLPPLDSGGPLGIPLVSAPWPCWALWLPRLI